MREGEVQFNVLVPESLRVALRRIAEIRARRYGVRPSVSALVVRALQDLVEREGKDVPEDNKSV